MALTNVATRPWYTTHKVAGPPETLRYWWDLMIKVVKFMNKLWREMNPTTLGVGHF